MTKTLFISFFCCTTLLTNAQTPTIDLEGDFAVCGDNSNITRKTLTRGSGSGSPLRYAYANMFDYTITWNAALSRWEAYNVNGHEVTFVSSVASYPNPPNLSFGNWASTDGCGCGILYALSGTGVQGGIVLPVDLLSFEGQNTEGVNRLTWTTAQEKNVVQFDIQRSNNGRYFDKIGKVKAQGSNAIYDFSDNYPQRGVNFYRLIINGLDGNSEYSKIIAVQSKGKTKVLIYPSVTTGILTIDNAQSFHIFNTVEQIVAQSESGDSVNGQHFINLRTLVNGLYIVRGVDKNGVRFAEKIVKQ